MQLPPPGRVDDDGVTAGPDDARWASWGPRSSTRLPSSPAAVGTLGDTGAPKVESVRWIRPASSVPALPLLGGFPFIW